LNLKRERATVNLVVLGYGLGRVSGGIGPVLRERLDFAVTLFKAGGYERLIFSGGVKESGVSEARAMLHYVRTSCGISETDVSLEERSLTTVENARELRSILGQTDEFTVVTSKAHVRRTRWIFKKIFGREVAVCSPKTDCSGLLGIFWEIPAWILSIVRVKWPTPRH